jgi:aryl-alcohol dehydrogenase-like predicted oxidoreductase
MQYTTLGRTELRVSVAGLGGGGFSRLGLKAGKTKAEAARLVLEATDLGVNVVDTAAAYGTEGVVGRALASLQREQVVISTKSTVRRGGERLAPREFIASLDNSLRVMGTDYIDVFNVHGVQLDDYEYALDVLVPVLDAEKRKGKIRHIGVTEAAIVDHTNEMLKRALRDPVWEVFMVAFHMMHQIARTNVFAQTQAQGIGTLLMFAVRSIFADRPRIAREIKALAAKGLVDPSLGATDDPLGFLIYEGSAASLVEAAYRYARHEPGVDVVLFGTGDAEHLRSNVASLLKPPLPEADRAKLAALFGHLTGVGLDDPRGSGPTRK